MAGLGVGKLLLPSILVLNFCASIAWVESKTPTSADKTVALRPISGNDIYNVFARSCSDESWKIFSTWASRTDFQNRQMPAATYVVSDDLVRSKTDGFRLEFKEAGRLLATIDNQKYEGSLCDLAVQIVSANRKSASLLDFALPRARAADLKTSFSTGDKAFAIGFVVGGAAAGAMFANPATVAAGALSGGLEAAVFLGLRSIEIYRNRSKLEDELMRLQSDDGRQFVSCTPNGSQLRVGNKTVTVTRKPKREIRIAGRPDPTGVLNLNNNEPEVIAARWSQHCVSKEIMVPLNQRLRADNEMFNRRVARLSPPPGKQNPSLR
jgi:hypothetical protein